MPMSAIVFWRWVKYYGVASATHETDNPLNKQGVLDFVERSVTDTFLDCAGKRFATQSSVCVQPLLNLTVQRHREEDDLEHAEPHDH